MLDENPTEELNTPAPDSSGATGGEEAAAPPRKRAARKTATKATATKAATKAPVKTPIRRTTKKVAAADPAPDTAAAAEPPVASEPEPATPAEAPAEEKPAPRKRAAAKKTTAAKTAAPAKKAAAKRTTTRKKAAAPAEELPFSAEPQQLAEPALDAPEETEEEAAARVAAELADAQAAEAEAAAAATPAPQTALLFQAPDPTKAVRRPRKTAAKKAAAPVEDSDLAGSAPEPAATEAATDTVSDTVSEDAAEAPAPRKRSRRRPAADVDTAAEADAAQAPAATVSEAAETESQPAPAARRRRQAAESPSEDGAEAGQEQGESEDDDEGGSGNRRRRRRGGRRRRKSGDDSPSGEQDAGEQDGDTDTADTSAAEPARAASDSDDQQDSGEGTSRRRRRRRRAGDDSGTEGEESENTVTRVRRPRTAEDEITSISGSTRLEAKKQRRRDGREAGRRRAPIVSEAEFLARREAVERVMVIRQRGDLTQIGVLEDKVLVEHYVARESQTSLIGNVYLGRVQNVLPSMEAAFVDIGKGRNAVLYAGEVNWSALGHRDNQPRKIESVLSSGQPILVQVTKDPIGHKGARLTSQISLAGRFLVYVPDGTTSGISRKLPDTERSRLKALLKEIVPEGAGVIVRTAAEGASEDELTRDVERLAARWEDIAGKAKGNAPQMLYGEPDLTLKVVRDLFTEDFSKLVIQGDDAWDTVQNYVSHVAPDLVERLERYDTAADGPDIFAAYRVEEQIAKGLDRKVWLPSGGSLVIDRTEAMTVVDVNTGKFTGSGGNLEETVTKNNLEAAEEIVRQLRLRDIGGIIVVDFIDMVLESNRDLVLRRLVECLGRDRTKHQVAEVTSLGLVQMTRKRIGTGLVESFSENCDHCQGRGVVIHDAPVEPRDAEDEGRRGARRGRGPKGRGESGGDNRGGDSRGGDSRGGDGSGANRPVVVPSPKAVAAVARPENAERPPADEPTEAQPIEVEAAQVEAPEAQAPLAEPAATGDADQAPAEAQERPTRSRRSRSRGGANRAEQAEASASEPAQPEPAQPEPAQPQAAPAVESASPEAAPAAEPMPAAEPAPAGTSQVTKRVVRTRRAPRVVSTAPVAVKVQEQADPTSVAETPLATPLATPPAPKVVTRTRSRRTADPAAAGGGSAAENDPAS